MLHNFLYLVNHEADYLHMYLHLEEDEHSEDSQEDEDDGVDSSEESERLRRRNFGPHRQQRKR